MLGLNGQVYLWSLKHIWIDFVRAAIGLALVPVSLQFVLLSSGAWGQALVPHKVKQFSPTKPTGATGIYDSYLMGLRKKVLDNWDYPTGKNSVTLKALVNVDGSVGELDTKSQPLNGEAEQSAKAAFAQAQPLEPLPDKNVKAARVTLKFVSQYDPHGDANFSLSAQLDPLYQLHGSLPGTATKGKTP